MSEELAWAAGFWDGEGSCGCYGRNDGRKRKASNSYLRASVNQIHREVLDRFCAAVELGKVYGPYVGRNTQWEWQLHGEERVRLLFERLWPWLSSVKREQFLAACAKHESRGELAKGGHVCASDCTCGRQKWKTQELDPKVARRRQQQRDATRRYRQKKKLESAAM